MDETIIYRCLSGTASADEQRKLTDWLHVSIDNQAAFFELKAIWKARQSVASSGDAEAMLARSLQQLNARINRYEAASAAVPLRRRLLRWSSAAALLLLLVLLPFLLLTDRSVPSAIASVCTYTNLSADTVCRFNLPDGTAVWLNSHSTLTCSSDFQAATREVQLTGEAFFNVVQDVDRPFIVSTDVSRIRVIGTSFSVNTLLSGGLNETILMSGSVELQEADGKSLALLRPGQQALYNKENQSVCIRDVDVNSLTSWRFGLVSLTDTPLREILSCLEETYGVSIQMDTLPLRDRRYNFSFKRSKGIAEALKQLSYMTGVPAGVRSAR